MKVVDKGGEWFINTSEHRIPDYQRHTENPGEDMVFMEPGVPTKIKPSGYLLGQPTIVACPDPMSDDAPAPKAKK